MRKEDKLAFRILRQRLRTVRILIVVHMSDINGVRRSIHCMNVMQHLKIGYSELVCKEYRLLDSTRKCNSRPCPEGIHSDNDGQAAV